MRTTLAAAGDYGERENLGRGYHVIVHYHRKISGALDGLRSLRLKSKEKGFVDCSLTLLWVQDKCLS
jgi:hypothetical protein